MKFKAIALALLAVCILAVPARAGTFPDKPVEAIVPWAPGGGGDLVFRAIATVFPKYANGQPLLIKNIPGAAGAPGIIEFMKAKPDGYTVAHWNGAQTIKTHMSETPYTATQFLPVAGVVNDSFYMLAPAASRFGSLKDLVEFAKANPGELNLGNAGFGGGNHFAALMFEDHTGIDVVPVPFQGGGPLITGLLSEQVDVGSNVIPEGVSNIKGGQLKILGIFSAERHPFFPDSPTAREQGFDLVLGQYRGVVAPAGTPPERIKELEAIFRQITQDPDFIKQITDLGSKIEFLEAEAYGATVAADDKNYKEIIMAKKLGDLYK